MNPDLNEAKRFLALLDDQPDFTFQTFDDSAGARTELIRVLHGSLDQHGEELTALNEAGAGVFVMINAGDGVIHEGNKTCRTTANVVRVRALFVDLDGAPLEPLQNAAAAPDILVESSPGRYHGYWTPVDCPLAAFKNVQRHLIAKFQADPKVIDLPRVMRLPGFLHQKASPFMTRILKP